MSTAKTALAEASANALSRKKAAKPAAITPLSEYVRLSVDIDPIAYRQLVSWCQDVAMAVGRVRVKHVWVIRAVLQELLENKDLQARVIERVREDNSK